jgi:hypothetical protein
MAWLVGLVGGARSSSPIAIPAALHLVVSRSYITHSPTTTPSTML